MSSSRATDEEMRDDCAWRCKSCLGTLAATNPSVAAATESRLLEKQLAESLQENEKTKSDLCQLVSANEDLRQQLESQKKDHQREILDLEVTHREALLGEADQRGASEEMRRSEQRDHKGEVERLESEHTNILALVRETCQKELQATFESLIEAREEISRLKAEAARRDELESKRENPEQEEEKQQVFHGQDDGDSEEEEEEEGEGGEQEQEDEEEGEGEQDQEDEKGTRSKHHQVPRRASIQQQQDLDDDDEDDEVEERYPCASDNCSNWSSAQDVRDKKWYCDACFRVREDELNQQKRSVGGGGTVQQKYSAYCCANEQCPSVSEPRWITDSVEPRRLNDKDDANTEEVALDMDRYKHLSDFEVARKTALHVLARPKYRLSGSCQWTKIAKVLCAVGRNGRRAFTEDRRATRKACVEGSEAFLEEEGTNTFCLRHDFCIIRTILASGVMPKHKVRVAILAPEFQAALLERGLIKMMMADVLDVMSMSDLLLEMKQTFGVRTPETRDQLVESFFKTQEEKFGVIRFCRFSTPDGKRWFC